MNLNAKPMHSSLLKSTLPTILKKENKLLFYITNTFSLHRKSSDSWSKHSFQTVFFISFITRNMLQNQGRLGFYIFLLFIAFNHICLSQSQSLENDSLPGNRTYFHTKLNGYVNSTKTEKDYLEKYSKFENSVAAVLIKVAYGTTSTTKRSIPENNYGLSLTTVATPFLTTQR